jgi:hypothetical protein
MDASENDLYHHILIGNVGHLMKSFYEYAFYFPSSSPSSSSITVRSSSHFSITVLLQLVHFSYLLSLTGNYMELINPLKKDERDGGVGGSGQSSCSFLEETTLQVNEMMWKSQYSFDVRMMVF